MIQYIMFNGHKYIPTSELTEKEQQNLTQRRIGHRYGLHFCITGSETRYFELEKHSCALEAMLS